MFIQANGAVLNDGARYQDGRWEGAVGQVLSDVRAEPGLLRPFVNERGQRCVNIRTGKMVYNNATRTYHPEKKVFLIDDLVRRNVQVPNFVRNSTSLTRGAWIELDNAVVRATRKRLRAWTDLRSRSSVGGFDAMGKTTYEYQATDDPGEAVKDMDALTDGRRDRPNIILKSVPLPITHSDFSFSAREIAISQNSRVPLNTTMAEAAGRRVAEMIEKTLIGVETGITFGTQTTGYGAHTGTSTEYGYTNFPYRVTKTNIHSPSGSSPELVIQDLIAMRETMYSNGFYGPFMVYTSTPYDAFLDDDYFRTGGTSVVRTVRERAMEIEGIEDIVRLDYLTSGYQILMIQMDSEVIQAINGMDITTVMWETKGGLQMNWKVMAIQVPLLKSPLNGVSGVLHGTTS
jgi:hypothetical protein